MPAVAEAGPAGDPPVPGPAGRGGPREWPPRVLWRRWRRAGLAHRTAWGGALLVVALLALMAVRLPWDGDLGIHAATLERLRVDLLHPGDPLVDADVASPYYSPWMVSLALLARVTGLSTFGVLRVAAAVDLLVLVTGIRRFVRTFTARPAAVPVAVLCVTLMYGWSLFAWSGFPGLTSLALCLAYPSTLALGIACHLWALLRRALAGDWPLAGYLGLGALLGTQSLIHQFTGVVTVLGLLAVLLGARPFPGRAVWSRAAAAAAVAVAVPLVWPYYSFFALFGVGGLDPTHRPLYTHLLSRFGLVLIGVAALALRFARDRRDPLVLLFAFGAVGYAVGGVTGHYALGRVLPAVLLSAQVALAVEVTAGHRRPLVRRSLLAVTAVGLLVGCWAQAGTLTFVLRPSAVPPVLRAAPAPRLWSDFSWITPYVRPGDVVMTDQFHALRQAPAYGVYTVASGYPDFFLPDQARRARDTARFFSATTQAAERARLLREYHVRWVITADGPGRLALKDPAMATVATHRI